MIMKTRMMGIGTSTIAAYPKVLAPLLMKAKTMSQVTIAAIAIDHYI